MLTVQNAGVGRGKDTDVFKKVSFKVLLYVASKTPYSESMLSIINQDFQIPVEKLGEAATFLCICQV